MMNNHSFHAKKSMDANSKSAIMTIDPSFAPSIIGTRGTNVARIQDATGTQIRVSAADGTATIVGTQAGIDAATTMIEQHMDRTSTVEIPFHHDMRELVFGPRGATVRRIEQESGANKVRIDRDRCVIVAIGSKQAAEYVKSFYSKLLADFSASGFTMRVDESLIGLIIGKRGSTVKEIESLSGCSITVSNPGVITLRGSKDAIHNARQMIDEVIRRDEGRPSHGNNAADSVVIPYPPVLFHHFTRRGVDNLSILDGLKLEFPGVASVDIARTAGQITMSGDEEGVAAASEKLHALITEASQFIATFNTSQAGARAVIGQGGSTVKDLERQLKVDINVSKSNVVTIYARGGDYALRFAIAEVEKVAAGAR